MDGSAMRAVHDQEALANRNAEAGTDPTAPAAKRSSSKPSPGFWSSIFKSGYEPNRDPACGAFCWRVPWHGWFLLVLVTTINLANYIERYVIAPHLDLLRREFNIGTVEVALLNTGFIASLTVASLIAGIFGDRVNRVLIISAGLLFWGATTFSTSFVPIVEENYIPFLCLRTLVGVGEGVYNTLCPTIITDYYSGKQRTFILVVYQFAIPFGAGISFVYSVAVEQALGLPWVFRILGIILFALATITFLLLREPPRQTGGGQAIDGVDVDPKEVAARTKKSVWQSVRYMVSVPSVRFTALAFACVSFALGGLAFYAIEWMILLYQFIQQQPDCDDSAKTQVSLLFGTATVISGLAGVVLGGIFAHVFRGTRLGKRAEGVICCTAMASAAGICFVMIFFAHEFPVGLTWVLVFIIVFLINLNWVPTIEITMTIVTPTQRALTQGAQMLVGHALGDAIAFLIVAALIVEAKPDPTLLPDISTFVDLNDLCANGTLAIEPNAYERDIIRQEYFAMRNALIICPAILMLGAFLYAFVAYNMVKDRERAISDYAEELAALTGAEPQDTTTLQNINHQGNGMVPERVANGVNNSAFHAEDNDEDAF